MCSIYNKRKLIMPSLPTNPTHVQIDEYVNEATKEELITKYNTIGPDMMGFTHPIDEYLKFKIEEKIPEIKNKNGGRRRSSKKHPTARRRRRSSKARKSRKARATRRR